MAWYEGFHILNKTQGHKETDIQSVNEQFNVRKHSTIPQHTLNMSGRIFLAKYVKQMKITIHR